MEPPAPTPPSQPCPRCRRVAERAFDASGVCVRCAGAQIFSQTMADKPGSTPPIPPAENSGGATRIGPYAVISELGRGGMGVVYLAQHIQLGRIVALKVIPSGAAATSDLEMRFLREARTIARLNHPRIVTVHDAGRAQGHAYFSMDYFEGGDLARRLREHSFAPREAATLLHSVAEAIAYSHAEGVLHRDLKPSNIMLAEGGPRVADFGLAAELDSRSGLTAHATILGTPHYLAPEALSGGSAAQGVPSDLYSLGVILHEMLTGRTPFAGASPAELPGLLAQRAAPAVRLLAPHVPHDLAVICGKCLEYDPADRYATVAALAEDLRRFLAGEPIVARPVSAPSQLFRWARRRPALAATWTLSFALAAASLTAAVLINRERVRGDAEAASNKALADFLGKDLLDQASSTGQPDRDLRLRTVLDRARERLPGRFPDHPLVEATVRVTLATTYHALGEFATEEQLLRPAWSLRRHFLGPDAPATLHAAVVLAECLVELGRFDDSLHILRPTSAALIRTLGPVDRETLRAVNSTAAAERYAGHTSEAAALLEQNLSRARRTLGASAEESRNALGILASTRWDQGRFVEAEALNREALAYFEHELGPEHAETLMMRANLATIFTSTGRYAEAEAINREILATRRRLLGADHPETLRSLSNLASSCLDGGKAAEALALNEELSEARRRVLGPDHPDTLLAQHNLATALGRSGQMEQAIKTVGETVDASTRTLGADHLSTLRYRRTYAGMLASAQRLEEAIPLSREILATSRRLFGPDNPQTIAAAENLAGAFVLTKNFADAEPLWREAAETRRKIDANGWRTAYARGQLGKTLALLNRPAEAEPLLREGYATLFAQKTQLIPTRRRAPDELAAQLATVCATLGRPAEAAEWQAKVTVTDTAKR